MSNAQRKDEEGEMEVTGANLDNGFYSLGIIPAPIDGGMALVLACEGTPGLILLPSSLSAGATAFALQCDLPQAPLVTCAIDKETGARRVGLEGAEGRLIVQLDGTVALVQAEAPDFPTLKSKGGAELTAISVPGDERLHFWLSVDGVAKVVPICDFNDGTHTEEIDGKSIRFTCKRSKFLRVALEGADEALVVFQSGFVDFARDTANDPAAKKAPVLKAVPKAVAAEPVEKTAATPNPAVEPAAAPVQQVVQEEVVVDEEAPAASAEVTDEPTTSQSDANAVPAPVEAAVVVVPETVATTPDDTSLAGMMAKHGIVLKDGENPEGYEAILQFVISGVLPKDDMSFLWPVNSNKRGKLQARAKGSSRDAGCGVGDAYKRALGNEVVRVLRTNGTLTIADKQ